MKKLLIGLFAFLVLLLVAAVALPILYKDEITAKVKNSVNENLNATFNFSDVDISIFKHFPKLSVALNNMEITGIGDFEGVKLLSADKIEVGVNFWQAVVGQNVNIQEVHLVKPAIRVYALKNGKTNYDIAKETTTSSESTSGVINLERYTVTDGYVLYDDRALGMVAEIEGLNHEGKGNFGADVFDLMMSTNAEKVTVDYEGIKYLSNANTNWKSTLNANSTTKKYTFIKNDIKVNDLEVNLDGWVAMPNDKDITMDLTFGAPKNTFKSLLSIIPGAFTKDFAGVSADGNVEFKGFARGTFNEKTYPAFKIDMKVGNGSFKYPTLPLGVSNINLDMAVNSPSANLNSMTVNVPKFSLKVGSNPLEGYFNLKTPVSDPTVDTKVKGTLNFAELAKAFPMEGVQSLSGLLRADVTMKAAMSQIEQQLYDQVNMAGNFTLEGFNYNATGTPPIKINTMAMDFNPRNVLVRQFDAKLGKSDIIASGTIDNILAYFGKDKTMTGNMVVRSGYFDANEWLTETTDPKAGKVPDDVVEKAPFDAWDFTIDGNVNKLVYEKYNMTDVAMKGHFTPNAMNVSDFGMKIGSSDIKGSGTIQNAWNFLYNNQTLKGNINLSSFLFDMNQFMTDQPTAAEPAPEDVMLVPKNIDMTINADMKRVLYTDLVLENLTGAVEVKDQVASLKDCTANLMGGRVGLQGGYSTREEAKPKFDLNMALQDFGFKESFQKFVTIKSFAPIMQFMEGKFNTTLSLSGVLGKNMTPDLKSLNVNGFLETINATIKNFKIANTIGEKLNLDYLKNIELQNSKNWLEIKDGQLVVKPFDVKVKDSKLTIGGSHGLDTDMNYSITTRTPRKTLEKNPVGAAASSGLNWLSSEAGKIGVNLNQGEWVNVLFNIGGTMANPKVNVKFLGTDGTSTVQDQVKETAQEAINKAKDSLSNVANRELEIAKGKAKEAVDKATDSLKRVAERELERAKAKAAEEAGKVINKEIGDKVGDQIGKEADKVLGDKGKDAINKAKDKLDSWDPFKKKKKE